MPSFISSVLNLVSRSKHQKPSVLLEEIVKKTEELVQYKNARVSFRQAKIKNIQRDWAASIIAGEGGGGSKLSSHLGEVPVGRREPEYLKRVSGADKKGPDVPKEKKVAKVYRRRLSDSSWTTEPMDTKLIWVDCEMTGLDVSTNMIMEIGCLVTGPDLKEIARTDSIIIHVPEERLQGLDAWCLKHHGDSGLIEACRQSKVTSEEVDILLSEFVQKHTKQGECPMAGNSIYMDRLFISKQFPKFHSHFHYRNVDVSTLKELVRRWYPDEYVEAPKKKFAHRVIADIEDSIDELAYYKKAVFKDSADNSLISRGKN